MSDLQIILIFVGGFIIAGVIAYNYVQERNLRNKITRDFIVPHADVLTEDFYIDADAYLDKELPEANEKFKANQLKISGQVLQHVPQHVPQHVLQQESATTLQASQSEADQLEASYTDINQHVDNTSMHDQVADQRLAEFKRFELDANHVEVERLNGTFIGGNDADDQPKTQDFGHLITNNKDNFKKVPVKSLEMAIDTETPSSQLSPHLHPQIDLTAVLFANTTINSATLINLASEIADINQIMVLYALDDDGKWQLLAKSPVETQFKQVSCSIQLADRGGPIARHMLNKFQFAVENMGSELNAHVEWQSTGDAMQHALALDQFCIEVDQLISVHVVQNENAIHGTKFKGIAEANGLSLNDDGRFYYYGNLGNAPLFSIIDTSNQAFTLENLRHNVFKSLSFQLEIPKVTNSEQVFNQMIMLAQKMAISLGASLVDDKQKPLNDLQIEKIKQQLKIIHAKMVARNIMPGSSGALRLFN